MKRRVLIAAICGAVLWGLGARAQPAKVWRIGFLRAARPPQRELDAFLQALSDKGFIQARNFVLVEQWGDGNVSRLPELAAELVNKKVDIVVTEGTILLRSPIAC
ncbi:hypothetical protein [Bradyrhizobium sp. OAE829]|uniref:hypothetical protein n=1 Tax=Bradyrhizobium sp. OAE829 TaxID=2663807 RepID=UPI00178BDC88